MVRKILNLLKEQKRYFIILILLLAMTIWLLWKVRWMLYLLLKLVYLLLYPYQTELQLVITILSTLTIALIISKTKKKSYSQLIKMRQEKILSKNLFEDSEQKHAIRVISEFTKTLMNFSYITAGICSLMLLKTLVQYLLKTF